MRFSSRAAIKSAGPNDICSRRTEFVLHDAGPVQFPGVWPTTFRNASFISFSKTQETSLPYWASTASTSSKMSVTILNSNGWLFSHARTRSTSLIDRRKWNRRTPDTSHSEGYSAPHARSSSYLNIPSTPAGLPLGDPIVVTCRA